MPDVRYLTMTGGVPVAAVPAEIDITTAEQLRTVLLGTAACGHATIVVDMSGTVFCDSSGLHAVLRAHKRAVSEDGELRLVMPARGAVPRIVRLTALDRLVSCFPGLAQALARHPSPWPGAVSSGSGRRRRSRAPGPEEAEIAAAR